LHNIYGNNIKYIYIYIYIYIMSGFYAKKAISITNDNDEVPLLWDDTWSEEHKLQKLQKLQPEYIPTTT
jgi:hypothetical protein